MTRFVSILSCKVFLQVEYSLEDLIFSDTEIGTKSVFLMSYLNKAQPHDIADPGKKRAD